MEEGYLVALAIFALIFLFGAVVSIGANGFSRGSRLRRALLARYGAWAGWLGGAGMLAIALRYTNVPLFSKRLWTFLVGLSLLTLALHFVWYRLFRYPPDLAEERELGRRRRFLPHRSRRRR